jgi:Lsr2
VQVTIDSKDSLESTLRVVGSLYGVDLAVASPGAAEPQEEAPSAEAPARRGRKAAAGKRATRRSRRSAASESSAADLAAVRAWARENGYEVSDRGRVSNAILDAYRQRAS